MHSGGMILFAPEEPPIFSGAAGAVVGDDGAEFGR